MPELRLCTSTTVSVALKPFNYEVHGHDVAIEACWCGDLNRRVDVELLARKLRDSLQALQQEAFMGASRL